ncbi:MAG TPA: hypothetical protein VK277_04010 [Acidimicrobiales bacterium]|nr:hypothetical protein [Acidimicrobiales bacterium]
MDYLIRRLVRAGTAKGVGEGRWAWLVLAGTVWLFRRARRQHGALVTMRRLSPGEGVAVTIYEPDALPSDLGL